MVGYEIAIIVAKKWEISHYDAHAEYLLNIISVDVMTTSISYQFSVLHIHRSAERNLPPHYIGQI